MGQDTGSLPVCRAGNKSALPGTFFPDNPYLRRNLKQSQTTFKTIDYDPGK
jgi:hypothetical protein